MTKKRQRTGVFQKNVFSAQVEKIAYLLWEKLRTGSKDVRCLLNNSEELVSSTIILYFGAYNNINMIMIFMSCVIYCDINIE